MPWQTYTQGPDDPRPKDDDDGEWEPFAAAGNAEWNTRGQGYTVQGVVWWRRQVGSKTAQPPSGPFKF